METYCKAPVVSWTTSVFTWIIKLGFDQILLADHSIWLADTWVISAGLDIHLTGAEPCHVDISLKQSSSLKPEQSAWGSESFPRRCRAVMETSARALVWLRSGEQACTATSFLLQVVETGSSPLDVPPLYSPHCSEGSEMLHPVILLEEKSLKCHQLPWGAEGLLCIGLSYQTEQESGQLLFLMLSFKVTDVLDSNTCNIWILDHFRKYLPRLPNPWTQRRQRQQQGQELFFTVSCLRGWDHPPGKWKMLKTIVLLVPCGGKCVNGACKRPVGKQSSGDWEDFQQFPNCSHIPKPHVTSSCPECVTTAFLCVPGDTERIS